MDVTWSLFQSKVGDVFQEVMDLQLTGCNWQKSKVETRGASAWLPQCLPPPPYSKSLLTMLTSLWNLPSQVPPTENKTKVTKNQNRSFHNPREPKTTKIVHELFLCVPDSRPNKLISDFYMCDVWGYFVMFADLTITSENHVPLRMTNCKVSNSVACYFK